MDAGSEQKLHRGRWPSGQSGNPKGRPTGSRNKTTVAAEALLEGQAESLTEVCINRALAGDMAALKLCIERIIPIRKERFLNLSIPELRTANDLLEASRNVVAAIITGKILPTEGLAMANLIEQARKIMELTELEERLASLEKRAIGTA